MAEITLPKIDLHRHLDGSIRVSTILELATEHALHLPSYDLSQLEKEVYIQDRSTDLLAFLAKLDYGVSSLVNIEACERIAFENVEDLRTEGVDYAELRFSPYYMAMHHNLSLSDVVAAVVRGVKAGEQRFGVKVNLIGILSRTFGVEHCMQELESLLKHHQDLVGLDLAGDEKGFPAELFQAHFSLAKQKTDWRFTVHAGEADGPQSVWNAITLLHADRIGHGVRAIEDEKLLSYMAEKKVGVESCLTSNYQTGTWIDTASHPLITFLNVGIEACLNTDDPGVSNITLDDEFELARRKLNFTEAQLNILKENALNQAFISEPEKEGLR
jgi:adenosine deaminase